jgi:cytochrome c oxidase subunit II
MRLFFVVVLACAAVAAGCGGSDSGDGGSASAPGEDVYREYACASCHSLDGSEGTGPSFEGLAGSTVKLEGGKTVTADAGYLKRSITEPDAEIVEGYPEGIMTASIDNYDLGSKPEDVDRLVQFIQGVE